jgi:hypothetical protein
MPGCGPGAFPFASYDHRHLDRTRAARSVLRRDLAFTTHLARAIRAGAMALSPTRPRSDIFSLYYWDARWTTDPLGGKGSKNLADSVPYLGSAHDLTWTEAWERLSDMRRAHLAGEWDRRDCCRTCNVWSVWPDVWKDRGVNAPGRRGFTFQESNTRINCRKPSPCRF